MGNRAIRLSTTSEIYVQLLCYGILVIPIALFPFIWSDRTFWILSGVTIFLAAVLFSVTFKDYKARQGYILSWDDVNLWLTREGSEVWRAAWSELSSCEVGKVRPFALRLKLKDGTVLEMPRGQFGRQPIDMLLRVIGINVPINGPTLVIGKPKERGWRWSLKNHILYGSKPNPEGKPVVFHHREDRMLKGLHWFQLAFYAFAVFEFFFFSAGLVAVYVLGIVHHAAADKQLELGFVIAFGLPMIAIVIFFSRAFVVSVRSLKTLKLGLRFVGDQVEIVNGDRFVPAQIETKKILSLSEYVVVRAGGKRYWFKLLMPQE